MKKYIVITKFADLEDGKHLYNVGDVYPRSNKVVSEHRIEELLGSNNKVRRPLIKEDISDPFPSSQDMKTDESTPKPTKAKRKPRRTQKKHVGTDP